MRPCISGRFSNFDTPPHYVRIIILLLVEFFDTPSLGVIGVRVSCYFVIVTMSVAIDTRVPMELRVRVSAGGIDHEERALEALGCT